MIPVNMMYRYEPFLFFGKVILPDGNGGIKGVYDPMKLATDFFTHSNDVFFEMYGFNWVPEEPYWSAARKKLGY